MGSIYALSSFIFHTPVGLLVFLPLPRFSRSFLALAFLMRGGSSKIVMLEVVAIEGHRIEEPHTDPWIPPIISGLPRCVDIVYGDNLGSDWKMGLVNRDERDHLKHGFVKL